MKGRILTETQIAAFAVYLKSEEKSENTIEKYMRDVRAFCAYVGEAEMTKETVIAYKNKLLSENYAARCKCYYGNALKFRYQNVGIKAFSGSIFLI